MIDALVKKQVGEVSVTNVGLIKPMAVVKEVNKFLPDTGVNTHDLLFLYKLLKAPES